MFEETLCPLIIGGGKAIKVLQSQMITGPGIQRLDRGHLRALGLVQRNINVQCCDKMCDDAAAKIVDCIKWGTNPITSDYFVGAGVRKNERDGQPTYIGFDDPR